MTELARALEARLGPGKVSAEPERLAPYGRDESGLPPRPPDVLVLAEGTADVVATLEVARSLRAPVTPCGARTGKSGGSLPAHGGISLSLERMDRIVALAAADLTATVQAGCVTGTLMAAAEEAGLFYPPDPNSWETCTLGGNVAENAGGPRALKYGVTRDYVLGLEAVLPSGEVVRTGRATMKGVAGYDLTSLLVGSEGTLAVVTEITVKLLPRPREVRTALAIFPDAAAAARAVTDVLGAGFLPRCLEFFDGLAIRASAGRGPYRFPAGAGAAVLVEADGSDADAVLAELLAISALCTARGALDVVAAQTEAQGRALWETRRQVSHALRALSGKKVSEDVVVPRSRLPEAVERAQEIGARHGFLVSTYGHAGDGNLHTNVLYARDDQKPAVDACVEELVRLALELGGTITGEHGVGLAKRAFLPWEQGPALLDLQRRLKAAFDPDGILNPGKIL